MATQVMQPQAQGGAARPRPKVRPKAGPGRKSPLAAAAAGPPATSPMVQRAQAMLDPVIEALTAAANDRAARAEAAIKGLTDSYASQIADTDYAAPYTGAEEHQAAVDAALQQALTGQGSDLASGLSGRLAALAGSSGAGALDQAAGQLASQGASAGTTRLASGSASLGDLIGQEAAAREYGTKMPGVVKLSGLQGVKQSEGNAQSEIAQGTLSAEQKIPDLVEQLKSDKRQAAQLKLSRQSQASENAYRQAELGLSSQRLQVSARQGQERLNIEAANSANTAAHDRAMEQMARANYGLSVQRLQDAETKARQVRARGGLTPTELDTVHSHAQDFIKGLYEGVPGHVTYPSSTNGLSAPHIDSWKQKPIKYQKAIKLLIQRYPALGPEAAIKIADSFYRPGEGGRPTAAQPELSAILGPPGGVAPPASPFAVPGAHHLEQIQNPRERATATQIVGLAQQFEGTPYVWGGETPKGFDCSGFAKYIYGHAGVQIPRTTYAQWQARNGHPVAPSALLPGDLVFFKGSDSIGGLPGHVGIYIGGGKMIDAPHTGASVRVEDVGSFGGYMGARRYR
jgi:NlpC/P60 family